MADTRINSNRNTSSSHPLESDFAHMHPLVSWRSILAGLLVSFLSLATLLSLGMAFGGIGLDDGTSAQRAGVFSGVWFLVASIVSLAIGSYFAARVSKLHTNRLGAAQGVVIASLFFGVFLWQSLSAIGWVGQAAGSAVSGAATMVAAGAEQAAGSQMVRNIVEDAIGDLNLRSEPQIVISGVASRLLQGNADSAQAYLARQTGISQAEAQTRITQLQTQLTQSLAQVRQSTAQVLQATGWSLFATLLLGVAAAISGGALGSRANYRKPLSREQVDAVSGYTAAPV